jgi:glutathione S-transferase
VKRVWGVGTSRTIRVHWALCELGIDYETREIIPRTRSMEDPEFLARSGRGKVPIFEDGDLVMGESYAIVFHLADRYRDCGPLAPEPGSDARARFDDLCLFTLSELDAPLYIVRRHEGLAETYGASPTAVDSARRYFGHQARHIERGLADGRPYLMGDAFSAADLLLASCLAWARVVEIELSTVLADHLERACKREAYKEAATRNFTPAALKMLQKTAARSGTR